MLRILRPRRLTAGKGPFGYGHRAELTRGRRRDADDVRRGRRRLVEAEFLPQIVPGDGAFLFCCLQCVQSGTEVKTVLKLFEHFHILVRDGGDAALAVPFDSNALTDAMAANRFERSQDIALEAVRQGSGSALIRPFAATKAPGFIPKAAAGTGRDNGAAACRRGR